MTNSEYVAEVYRAILGRTPDPAGSGYWTGLLDAGVYNRTDIYTLVIQTPEALKVLSSRVQTAYQTQLGREPAQSELDAWVADIVAGRVGPEQQMLDTLFQRSDEYRQRQSDSAAVGTGVVNPTSEPTTTSSAGKDPIVTTVEPRPVSAEVKTILNRYDLGGLNDWVQEQIISGASDNEIMIKLYDTPEFKTRFPAIEQRQSSGMAPLSPEEYIQYESNAQQLFRAAGLPKSFYDQRDDFTQFLTNNVSLSELSARVEQGFQKALTAPIEVRAKMTEFFGVTGDGALAAYFLDPEKALPALERDLATAEIAGYGQAMNVGIDQARSQRLADLGFTGEQASQGFTQISNNDGLFTETVTETKDLTAATTGVDATFGLDPQARKDLEQRRASRVNALNGGGSLALTNAGLAGVADK